MNDGGCGCGCSAAAPCGSPVECTPSPSSGVEAKVRADAGRAALRRPVDIRRELRARYRDQRDPARARKDAGVGAAARVRQVRDPLGRRGYIRKDDGGTLLASDLSVDEWSLFLTQRADPPTATGVTRSRPNGASARRATASAAGRGSDARATAIRRAWPRFGGLIVSAMTAKSATRSVRSGRPQHPMSPGPRTTAAPGVAGTPPPAVALGSIGPGTSAAQGGSFGVSAAYVNDPGVGGLAVGAIAIPGDIGGLVVPAVAATPATSIEGFPTEPVCYLYKVYARKANIQLHGTGATQCPTEVREDWDAFITDYGACPYNDYAVAAADLARLLGPEWEDDLWGVVGLRAASSASDVNLAAADREPLWWSWSDADTNYPPDVSLTPRAEVMMRALSLILDFEQGIPEIWEGHAVRDAVSDRIRAGLMSYRIYGPVPDAKWDDLSAVITDLGDAVNTYLEAGPTPSRSV